MSKREGAGTDRAKNIRLAKEAIVTAAMRFWRGEDPNNTGPIPTAEEAKTNPYAAIRYACWKLHKVKRGR